MSVWEYFEWDYGRRLVTTWRRLGVCNGCGACCRASIRYQPGGLPVGVSAFMGHAVGNTQGVWLEARRGKQRLFANAFRIDCNDHTYACGQLAANGSCKLHHHKRNMPLCDVWPMHPSQVAPFPQCSYDFEQGDQESF